MAYGSISKTGENKFRVCFDYGKDGSGKRIRKYQTFSSKREAEHALNRHKVEMDTGNFVMPADWTFAQWMDFWYDNIILPQIEATTAYGYKSIIENHLNPQLGNCKLQKLSARHIQLYYTHLLNEAKLSPNSVLKHHNLLTNILNAAKRYEYITKNPMDAVSPPKKRRREAKYYTPEQLGQLLSLAARTRLELPIYICAYLGLRRGELCGLRWQDIDFEHHTVTIDTTRTQAGKDEIVKDTKTVSSTRTLYLPDTLYQMLQAEKAHQAACKAHLKNMYDDNPYVVVMENGKPFRPNYLSELFTKFLADNGLPKIVLHELRHTFASLSNQAGIPSFNIGKALGHSTPATTQKIYTHLLDQTHVQAVQGVAAIADRARLQASGSYLDSLSAVLAQEINTWDPMSCADYNTEIGSLQSKLYPRIDATTLGQLISDTFRESFGTRSFRCSLEECNAVAQRILSRAAIRA